eukprot:365846-Chlamydomonas_euryale.AAC.12
MGNSGVPHCCFATCAVTLPGCFTLLQTTSASAPTMVSWIHGMAGQHSLKSGCGRHECSTARRLGQPTACGQPLERPQQTLRP